MSRHHATVDRSARTLRILLVGVVWIGGLVAGFYALLSIVVRYGCGTNDSGLACRTSGSGVGIALVLAIVGVVTLVTVLAMNRAPRLVALLAVAGLIVLTGCFVGAHALLNTV